MPTGYTSEVQHDITFEEYALGCARAFGACAHQREASLSEPPKLINISDYYVKAYAKAQNTLVEMRSMNIPAQQEYGIKRIAERREILQEMFNKAIELRRKYEAMIANVNNWQAPNENFTAFKEFMLEQLTSSIKFDCDTEYYVRQLTELSNQDPLDMYTHELGNAVGVVEWAKNDLEKETETVKNNNAWIIDLYKSLGLDAPTV